MTEIAVEIGLTAQDAKLRLNQRGKVKPPASSRSYRSIVVSNTFTIFNLILAVFGTVQLIFGEWKDALFLGILVANTVIGIIQEVRAKHSLDRLSALVVPVATVIRDGRPSEHKIEDLVVDDIIKLKAGDQIVADAVVRSAEGLLVDESILTGESEPVRRGVGDELRSGAFVAEGYGVCQITAVGPDSYAEKLAGEAKTFRNVSSPLQQDLNKLLFTLVAVMVPLGIALGVALALRHTGLNEAVTTTVAAVVNLVPEGLILLTSLTYAVAALRMASHGALAQQLSSIESLASVDVICTDKTGTLTESSLRVVGTHPAQGVESETLDGSLGRYGASAESKNNTLDALARGFPSSAEPVEAAVPFSSKWRWSALRLAGKSYIIGAPELFELGSLAETAKSEAESGRRVLAFADSDDDLKGIDPESGIPSDAILLGLLVLAEELRGETQETVQFFLKQDVQIKVLSGDSPKTVEAIARDAGIPITRAAIDGSQLSDKQEALSQQLRGVSVIGRISPLGKKLVLQELDRENKHTAMIGDGVNDVSALKEAKVSIAQGSGSQMAKSISDIVLVSGDFSSIPVIVAEGRQVFRNLQRVAKLFVSKSIFAAFLILTVGISSSNYPFLPRHLSLASSLTIGIPAFFLALAPSSGPWRSSGFIKDLARFSVPAGISMGLAVLSGYLLSLHAFNQSLVEARTVATSVMVVVGLYFVLKLESVNMRRRLAVTGLCGLMLLLFLLALLIPFARDFFQLQPIDSNYLLCSAIGISVGVVFTNIGLKIGGFFRSRGDGG